MPTIESKPFNLGLKEAETMSHSRTKSTDNTSLNEGDNDYSSGLSDFEEDQSPKHSVLLKKAQSHLSCATNDQ